jgi:hypothetical protein
MDIVIVSRVWRWSEHQLEHRNIGENGKTKTAPFFKEPFWFYVFAELCAVDDEFIMNLDLDQHDVTEKDISINK